MKLRLESQNDQLGTASLRVTYGLGLDGEARARGRADAGEGTDAGETGAERRGGRYGGRRKSSEEGGGGRKRRRL